MTRVGNGGRISAPSTPLDPTTIHHGGLVGLADDDHPQYFLADGSRALSNLSPSLPIVSDATRKLVSLAYTGVTSFRKNLGLEPTDSPSFAALGIGTASPAGQVEIFTSTASGGQLYATAENDANYPQLIMRRAKTGPALVASGNVVGYVDWCAFDGSVYRVAARISGEVGGTPGSGDMPGALVLSTTPDASVTPTEAMRIYQSQMVRFSQGLGLLNTTPDARMAIYVDRAFADPASGTYLLNLTLRPTWTGAETVAEYFRGLDINISPIINAGHNNSGGISGSSFNICRNNNGAGADENGTLAALIGAGITYGHLAVNATATPQTTTAYGIYIYPNYRTGTIGTMADIYIAAAVAGGSVTNRFGIYQVDQANNVFSGIIHGSVNANGDIHIKGTTHATKTSSYVLLQEDGGLVGIGTASPGATLDVNGSMKIAANIGLFGEGPASNYCIYGLNDVTDPINGYALSYLYNRPVYTGAESVSEVNYGNLWATAVQVQAGHTNSGTVYDMYFQNLRNANGAAADDSGTLTNLYDVFLAYGHHSTNPDATPQTTNAHGIHITPYSQKGTITTMVDLYLDTHIGTGTVTNRWAIYQEDAAARNFFAGPIFTEGGVHVGSTPDPGANNLLVDGSATVTGASILNGAVTLGDAADDVITVNGTISSDVPLANGVRLSWDAGAACIMKEIGFDRLLFYNASAGYKFSDGNLGIGVDPAAGISLHIHGTTTSTGIDIGMTYATGVVYGASLAVAGASTSNVGLAIMVSNGVSANKGIHIFNSYPPPGDNNYALYIESIAKNWFAGPVGIATQTFGASAGAVLGLGLTTAPTTAPADIVQLWANDIGGAAGKTSLLMMSESGTGVQTVVGVITKTDTGDPTQVHEGLMCINTFDNKVKIYAEGAWRQIATW